MKPADLVKIFTRLELTKEELFQFSCCDGKLNICAPISKNAICVEKKGELKIEGDIAAETIFITKTSEQSLIRVLSIAKSVELLIPSKDPTLPIMACGSLYDKKTATFVCGIACADREKK